MAILLLSSTNQVMLAAGFDHNQPEPIKIVIGQSDERPVLLFDTSVLKEEKEGQKVISYSKSNEISDIRKALVSLSEKYKSEYEILKCCLDNAERSRHNPRDSYAEATYNQRKAEMNTLSEKYHAQKTVLAAQEKNVYKKIKVVIEDIAKRWRWPAIELVSYDSNVTMLPYLIYVGRRTYDITGEILEALNKEYSNF